MKNDPYFAPMLLMAAIPVDDDEEEPIPNSANTGGMPKPDSSSKKNKDGETGIVGIAQ